MSRELTIAEIRDRFENEYAKMIPNEDKATPGQIRKAAEEVARKLNLSLKLKIRCTRPPGGRFKCEVDFELELTK